MRKLAGARRHARTGAERPMGAAAGVLAANLSPPVAGD